MNKQQNQEYCNNCGIIGHKFRDCNYPKTSYGIVCTEKREKNTFFLLICRRNSLSYIEFIRGRYKMYDANMLFCLFKHMTIEERKDILEKEFDVLWDGLWINNKYRKTDTRSDYEKGKKRFYLLREGIIINYSNLKLSLEYIIKNTYSIYEEPEWDFPKGRRNSYEDDIECAKREFCEETNFKPDDFKVIDDEKFVEIHIGTNGIKYRTIYFASTSNTDKKPEIDKNNKFQTMEISKIAWFSYEEALSKFRDYDIEKKNVIKNVYKKLTRKIINPNEKLHNNEANNDISGIH